jgi:hypothetical protein
MGSISNIREWKKMNAYVLIGKPEGKTPLEKLRRRWKDNTRLVLREIVCDKMDWVKLARDMVHWRAVVKVTKFWAP